MGEIEFMLTDEFINFSSKIAEIHTEKKKRAGEVKDIAEQFKADMHALDEKAEALRLDWEAWKQTQIKK